MHLLEAGPGRSSRLRLSFPLASFFKIRFRKRLKSSLLLLACFIIVAFTIYHRSLMSKNQQVERKTFGRVRFEAQTIKTVIGRYVGPNPTWIESDVQNLSDTILNTNNYDPDPETGKNGRPAYLPGYPKDQLKILYSINRFNLAASDKISVDRKLPDPRKTACHKKKFNLNGLPSTSIIIVFHNEAWSTLVRTVHSILNTAPQKLLAEILLVDDFSNRTFLNKSLDYYMANLESVRGVNIRIIRSPSRIGLIKSRLLGVSHAKGRVLTFIDAHCEATTGWLEPLLEQVKLDRTTAACPIIDIINEDTFAFTRSFELHVGAFNWGMNFRWFPISRRELIASNSYYKEDSRKKMTEMIQAFRSPIMAGGLFSIEKDYFNEIGKYDPELDIWGGENIELSLRIWQCGGKVKIVPCSHVAHVFRKSSPYTFRPGKEVGDILYSNLARVAEVWMDRWRNFFYLMNPIVNKTLEKVGHDVVFRNIESRKQLKHHLNCKSFEWFLDNIWPEHFFPKSDRFFGRIRQKSSSNCLQRPTVKIGMGQAAVGAIETHKCTDKLFGQQMFVFDASRGFVMTDENICLDSGSDPMPTRQIILAPCSESKRQKWEHTKDLNFKHIQSGLCLDSSSSSRVNLEVCDPDNDSLKWTLQSEQW